MANLEGRVRTLQIICFGLAGGVAIFGAIVGFLAFSGQAPLAAPAGLPVLSIVAAAVFVSSLAAAFALPAAMARSQLEAARRLGVGADVDHRLRAFQASTIVGMALPEGAAFMALIAFLVEGQLWTLGLAFAAVAIIFLRMPTVGKAEEYLAESARG